jgi:hypothetical protein
MTLSSLEERAKEKTDETELAVGMDRPWGF